jgi:hypothetical protein
MAVPLVALNGTVAATIAPKPFVFVLMPISAEFSDIYKFGIKGAAEDVNAYAERVDEQIFTEGILQRIINQIAKADVVVADMTGRNPNVFYEVGYAHALGKIVLLLTQDALDIPFDLKHHQHTVYGGKIDVLRNELANRLRWAISESGRRGESVGVPRMELSWGSRHVLDASQTSHDAVTFRVKAKRRAFQLRLTIRNVSDVPSLEVTHSYMLLPPDSGVIPYVENQVFDTAFPMGGGLGRSALGFGGSEKKPSRPVYRFPASDGTASLDQFRLRITLPPLPPGAVDEILVPIMVNEPHTKITIPVTLRLHSSRHMHEFKFLFQWTLPEETPPATVPVPAQSQAPTQRATPSLRKQRRHK